jgi:hypothetical protein
MIHDEEQLPIPECFPMTHEEMLKGIWIWRVLTQWALGYPSDFASGLEPEDWVHLRRLMVELSYYFELN